MVNKHYLSSQKASKICQTLLNEVEQNNQEHGFYKMGELAFNSKQFMDETTSIEAAKTIFGDDWKKTRYHNLVRLGGDIVRSGLAEYPKSTILGALLSYARNN